MFQPQKSRMVKSPVPNPTVPIPFGRHKPPFREACAKLLPRGSNATTR